MKRAIGTFHLTNQQKITISSPFSHYSRRSFTYGNFSHVKIYSFNASPQNFHILPVTSFLVDGKRMVRCWARHENTFASIYQYPGDHHAYVSLFDTTKSVPPVEMRFELSYLVCRFSPSSESLLTFWSLEERCLGQ